MKEIVELYWLMLCCIGLLATSTSLLIIADIRWLRKHNKRKGK